MIKNTFLLFVLLTMSFISNVIAQDYQSSGPIPITNQNPLYLFFLNPTPDSPDIQDKGKFSLDARYTIANVNVRQYSYPPCLDKDRVELDMEVHRLDLALTYGLTKALDVQLDIPYITTWGGFLDSVVEFFEDVLGVKAPSSRGDYGMNSYKYFLRYDSNTLIDKEDGDTGFGDISLFSKYKLSEEKGFLPEISLRGGVKFPTGSKDKFLGSGKFDYSLGVLAKKNMGRYFLYLNFDTIFINPPSVYKTMSLDDYILSGLLGVEFFLNQRLSLLLQGQLQTSPFPGVEEVTSLEHGPVHIGLGINYRFSDSVILKTSLIENGTSAWPDISLQSSLKAKF